MNLFEQIILGAGEEAAEIEKLKKSSANASKIQEIIDKLPDGKEKQEMQKMLNSTIKDLSEREQKTAPQATTPQATTPQAPAQQQQPQAPAQQQQPQAPAATQGQQQPAAPAQQRAQNPYATDYKGVSIVDFLAKSGQSSDFKSRQALAQRMGIKDYKGTAAQNTQMLKSLQKQAQDFEKTPAVATERQVAQANVQQPAQFQAGLDKQNTLNKVQLQEPEKPFPNTQNEPNKVYAKGPVAQPAQQVAQQQNKPNQPATPTSQPASQQTTAANQQSTDSPFVKDMKNVGTALKNSVSNIYGGNNPTKNANVAQQPKPKEKSEANEEKIKKCKDCGLNKITVQEKNNISKFLRHLSEKNYSSAHKYLKEIVSSKINKIVSERIDKI